MIAGEHAADQTRRPQAQTRWLSAAVAALLAVLALVAYYPALNTPLLFDDREIILTNENLTWSRVGALVTRDYFEVSRESTYRPLSTLSYLAAEALMGKNYRGWRLLNLGNHTLNAFLFFLLLGGLGAGSLFRVAAATLFLLHPAYSEVIYVISFNEDLLMTTFVLAAGLLLSRGGDRWTGVRIVAVAACYFLALLCKESAFFFPAVVLVWAAAGAPVSLRADKRWVAKLATALLLAAGLYAFVRFVVMKSPGLMDAQQLPREAIWTYVPTLLQVFASFVERFFWPSALSPFYYFPAVSWTNAEVLGGMFAILLLTASVAVSVRKRRFDPAIAATWFLAGMAILGYILLSGNRIFAYDRYLYFPAIGMIWLSLWALRELGAMLPLPQAWRVRAGLGALGLTLVVVLGIILRRNAVWSSERTLWEDAVRIAPDNPFSLTSLGVALDQAGEYSRALDCYTKAMQIMPDIPDLLSNYGAALVREGKPEEAAQHIRKAIRLRPTLREAYGNLGSALAAQGLYLEAAETFRKALRRDALDAQIHLNLGNVLFRQGLLEEADQEYRETLRIRPGQLDAMNNIGIVEDARGRYAAAVAQFSRALAVDPDHALTHHNLAATLVTMGDIPQARIHLRRALALRPDLRAAEQLLQRIGP